jgi:transcription elongation factor Elf1
MKTNNDVGEEEPEEQVKVVPQSNIAQSYLCPICGNQVKFSSVSVFKSRSKYSFGCVTCYVFVQFVNLIIIII